jgi:glycosyltransferase involved in cell wall biosynthesis
MKVCLFTSAYNAENTICRAIESILAQTYNNFEYYIFDNGSQDGTLDIISEYVKNDSRVHIKRRNVNNPLAIYELEADVFALPLIDWYANLDADDDYAPDFLFEMLNFANENNLDFVSCCSNFIDEATGASLNEFVLSDDIIIAGERFGTLFPNYFRFMGARWGKLINRTITAKGSLNGFCEYIKQKELQYRLDTAEMLWYLQRSERAGVLSKRLHNYRHHPNMLSKSDINGRLDNNLKMPEIYRDYLRSKIGFVSTGNETYIGEVLERSMRRTLALDGGT